MKVTLILYGSPKQYSAAHRPVRWAAWPEYYVRTEKSPFGLEEALARAKPMPGETVLNTVEVECGKMGEPK